MKYFDYTVKNHLTGKRSKGVITADNIESAEEALKRRGEDIIVISPLSDYMIFQLAPTRKQSVSFFLCSIICLKQI